MTSIQTLKTEIQQHLRLAEQQKWVERLWNKDTTLWTQDGEVSKKITNRLGWLEIQGWLAQHQEGISSFANAYKNHFDAFVVLGMGGSSLCTDVVRQVFYKQNLFLIDSTDPDGIKSIEKQLNLARTLFIVASKSGTTIEVEALRRYFEHRIGNKQQFIAITDPNTILSTLMSKQNGYLETFLNPPDIGGRFSAMSYFGLLPAALSGVSIATLQNPLFSMISQCKNSTVTNNPGALLGITLGVAAKLGKNKLTFLASKEYQIFGAWIEQLVAESTGKNALGILPIVDEPLMPLEHYQDDRIFVTFDSNVNLSDEFRQKHLVLDLGFSSSEALGAEFFRWEVATAIAGIVLGVNPFDEPNVTQSKEITRGILENETATSLADLHRSIEQISSPISSVENHFQNLQAGDYGCLLAYAPFTPENQTLLKNYAIKLSQTYRIPFSIGFGPRFLHSTGQFHKGGTNQGRFVQITCGNTQELDIPGWKFGFSALKLAQALGDFKAMRALERNIINLHFKDKISL